MSCFEPAEPDEQIFIGAGPPYVIKYDVTSSDPEVNLTEVTAVALEVLRESGQKETWTASIELSSVTSTFLRIIRVVDAADFPVKEQIWISPVLTLPSGTLRADPKILEVVSPFDPAIAS